MSRLVVYVFLLIGLTLLAFATVGAGIIYPVLWVRLSVLWFLFVGSVLLITVSAAIAIVHRAYHFARGRRDKSEGIPCMQCGRLAFPIEGTTTRYRCWNCGGRFDGPEHFP